MGLEEPARYWDRRRVSRRRLLRGAVIGGAGLALAGCAGSGTTPAAAPAPTTAPASGGAPAAAAPTQAPAQKRGGALKIMGTAQEKDLEPHVAGSLGASGGWGPYICYSQLIAYKWGPDIKPPSYVPYGDLAESWTQPDETTYTFKLRPGVKWHNIKPVNGRELVADDIIYSYNRVREQKSFAGYLAGVIKMEAVDKGTLKFTLDKPNADLLNNLGLNTLSIVAKEVVDANGGSLANAPVIGTGAWIFDSFTLNERFTANKNPDYFLKGQPYVDSFESIRSVEASVITSAFRAGAINVIPSGVTVQQAEDLLKASQTTRITWVPADRNTTELMLNHNLDIFKDIRVRQAISKAIDRKAIIDTVWLGRGGLTTGLSLPDPSYMIPDAELTKLVGRDVAGAKQLLSQAGVSNLSFEIIAPTYLSGAFVSLTELIQANLKDAGINTTIKTADTPAWATAQMTQNFQAITGTFAGAAPNGWLNTRYKTGGGQNYVKYSDPEMDKLIDQQAVMVKDPDGRKKVLQDIQRKIINDAVYIPVILYHQPVMVQAEVKDLYPPLGINGHSLLWLSAWLDK
jgi:peptide/nickel transport system substrate-binding protein